MHVYIGVGLLFPRQPGMPKSTMSKSLEYNISLLLIIVLILRNLVRPTMGVLDTTLGAVPVRYRHLLFLGRRNLKRIFN
jgi:hypothetical protein